MYLNSLVGKRGIEVLGLPSNRSEVTKVSVKSDEFSDKILLSLKTRKSVRGLLDYATRALFFAESEAAKLRAEANRSRVLSLLVPVSYFNGFDLDWVR